MEWVPILYVRLYGEIGGSIFPQKACFVEMKVYSPHTSFKKLCFFVVAFVVFCIKNDKIDLGIITYAFFESDDHIIS